MTLSGEEREVSQRCQHRHAAGRRVVEDECPCIDAGGRPSLGCPGLRPAAALPPPHRRRRWSRTSRPPTWIPWATADVLRDAADSGAAVLYSTRDEPVAAVAHGGQPAS